MNGLVALACLVIAVALGYAFAARAALVRERRLARERERLLRETVLGIFDTASVGSLLATFAHTGNNRLTAVLSCLDMLESMELTEDERQESVRLALGGAQQLAADVGALLACARRDAHLREPRDARDALARAQRLQALLGEVPLRMTCDVAPDLAIECEPGRLDLALLRLCLLAQRRRATAMDVRGLELELAARDPQRPSLRPGRYCKLEFRLDGVSLPPALLEPLAEAGHVVGRLRQPDTLDYAAVEAFALGQRGLARASAAAPAASMIELILPVVPRPAA